MAKRLAVFAAPPMQSNQLKSCCRAACALVYGAVPVLTGVATHFVPFGSVTSLYTQVKEPGLPAACPVERTLLPSTILAAYRAAETLMRCLPLPVTS